MLNIRSSFFVLFLVFVGNSHAAKLDYDYFEFRYVDSEIDDFNVDGDGFSVAGSWRVNDTIYAIGEYTTLDFDFNIDFTILEIGLGYIYPFKKNMDLIAEAAYVDIDADGAVNGSDNGFGLAFGARGWASKNVEARGIFNYVNVDDSDTFFELGADYFLTDQLSVGATIELGGDLDTFTIGGRFYFDR